MDELLRARLMAQIANTPVDWGMTAQGALPFNTWFLKDGTWNLAGHWTDGVAWVGGVGWDDGLARRIVLYRISGGDDYTMSGRTGYTQTRVQVDCYASSVGAAKLLGRQVKAALSGYRSGAIKGAFLSNERDLSPETTDADTIGRVSLDFFIHHQE